MTEPYDGPATGDRAAGICLVLAAAVSILAMAHHPTGAHGGGIGELVHGTMIVVLAVLFYGFAHFALRRGLSRPVILAGLVAYGVSLGLNLGAAIINGFVVPALAAGGSGTISHGIFVLCWEANQALARLAVFATGAAYALWSIDFLRHAAPAHKIVGGIGLLAGLVPAAALAGGAIDMTVNGALMIYAAHALWAVLVGFQFIRRKI